MKKSNFFVFLSVLFLSFSLTAQNNVKNISKIETGTTLTNDDIGFINMVSKEKLPTTRGEAKIVAKIAGKTYTVGKKLTKDDVASINKAIKVFCKTNSGLKNPTKDTPKSRDGLCYYWYYYCDYYGHCVYYQYWYYCY